MSSDNRKISDETLLGFVLGSLPDVEMADIQQRALSDAVLGQRIKDLADLLKPMQGSDEPIEPPSDLTSRTIDFIRKAEAEKNICLSSLSTSESSMGGIATRTAWLDSLVTLVAGVVILTFLLPSVWYSRESSRRLTCEANIREIGQAITAFAHGNTHHELPRIDRLGPLSFAGVLNMRIKDAGLLDAASKVWCPSRSYVKLDSTIPTTNAYLSASSSVQQGLRYTVGGNYSYNLGNVVAGIYMTPTLDSQYLFAILGDTLCGMDDEEEAAPIHGRNAANILYSDGSIHFIRVDRIDSSHDNPYFNRINQQAAGYGIEDCCLGPGFQFPLVPIRGE